MMLGVMILNKKTIAIVVSVFIILFLSVYSKGVSFDEVLFYDVLPNYNINKDGLTLFKYNEESDSIILNQESNSVVIDENESIEVVGINDVIIQEGTDNSNIQTHFSNEKITVQNIDKLRDMNYLKQNFYIVDKKTGMTNDYFNVDNFINTDLSIEKSDEPKILIFHTHASEMFADSDKSNIYDGIVGVGEKLKECLENNYGIKSIHNVERFDVVNGKSQIIGAYERMEPVIKKVIEENPSIEMVIDLHRDGVNENTRLVKNINGKDTAQIMFFNGLCRLYQNGSLNQISISNPYIKDNLALSFNMQLTANTLYPGFTRKVYLNAYRYSLHMMPKSMLIEVGAQTNTKQEAFNSAELIAEIIARVVS